MSMNTKRKQVETNIGLADRLHGMAIRLLRKLRGEDRASGLSPARLSALSVLVYSGEMTLGELAATEQVRAPTMSVTVRALEHAGLVRVQRGNKDGRQRNIAVTTRGQVVLINARERRVKRLADAIAGLPETQRRRLTTTMHDLENLIKELET